MSSKEKESEKTLYEKYNGLPGVLQVINYLYDELIPKDDLIGELFKRCDANGIKIMQVSFLSYLMQGPVVYKGSTIPKLYSHLNLTKP